MNTSAFDSTSRDLSIHSPWIRRLAESLVRDPLAADDVIQEAWTKLGSEDAPAGYLAAVVRSLAYRHRRGEARLRRREERAARAEALPSAAEVAERIEVVRRLARALDELDEPYRTTIVLRYFDDLSAAEIARRSQLPSSTVRVRLKRGLERLREVLDDQHGGRESWVSALIPLTLPARSLSSAVFPGLTSLVFVKLVLGVALAACGLVLYWTIATGGGVSGGPRLSLAEDSHAGVVAATDELAQLPQTDDIEPDQRTRAPVLAGKTAEEPRAAAGSKLGRISARIVDLDGRPIPSAWLRLREAPECSAVADADGRVTLDPSGSRLPHFLGPDVSNSIRVELGASGYRTVQLRPGFGAGHTSLELGEIELGPGSSVSGVVVDESGLGVADALVVFGTPNLGVSDHSAKSANGPPDLNPANWAMIQPAVSTRTGTDGHFRLAGLAPSYGIVWARGATTHWSFTEPIGVRSAQELDGIRLVVRDAREERITGAVLDPSGSPLPGLWLTFTKIRTQGVWNEVATDARGRFTFAPYTDAPFDISVPSPSFDWEHRRVSAVPIGSHDLVIQFESSEWLTVRVIDPAGKPIRNGAVAMHSVEGPTDNAHPRNEFALNDEGEARLRRPDDASRLLVRAPGYRDALLGPLDSTSLQDPLVVSLEALPALIGQVLLPDGRPASGATVQLHRGVYSRKAADVAPTGERAHVTHQSWRGDREAFVYALHRDFQEQVLTDEQGQFRLSLPGVDARPISEVEREASGASAGLGYLRESDAAALSSSKPNQPWYVHASLDGSATTTTGPLYFDSEEERELELHLETGGTIDGRLLIEGGESTSGWCMLASDGLARIAEAVVSGDGSFRFEHLHPGGWQLRAFAPGMTWAALSGNLSTSRVPEPDVQVSTGKTVTFEYVTQAPENAELRGRLLLNGELPGPWSAKLITSTEQAMISSSMESLDPEGHFRVRFEAGLKTSLVLAGHSAEAPMVIVESLVTEPGTTTWSLDLETASLEGFVSSSLANSPGRASLAYEVHQGERTILTNIEVGEDGQFGPVFVAAGQGRLRTSKPGNGATNGVLQELQLGPGEHKLVDLR